MKLQFEILFFIICLNLAVGLILGLNLANSQSILNPVNGTDLETQFNATKIGQEWRSSPIGIPIIGDIFSGFQFLLRNIQFLLDGFPLLMTYIADTITDVGAKNGFLLFANALRGIYAFLMFWFVIEFISGRQVTE